MGLRLNGIIRFCSKTKKQQGINCQTGIYSKHKATGHNCIPTMTGQEKIQGQNRNKTSITHVGL